ncbi:MAG: hypothetical protein Q7T81_08445 [Pseudolabrys sp.]|nr:hypothetical protein [Pseudolabrys sp.]
MTVHTINKICRQVLRDHDFRARMASDPAGAIAGYDLSDAERNALLAGDVVAMHVMGVNDFMMGYLARFGAVGLSVPRYNELIRSAPPSGH